MSPLNIYVQKGSVAVSFHLHGKLNILVDTVQAVKKSLSLLGQWSQMMEVSFT
jgi:hypothetical protein